MATKKYDLAVKTGEYTNRDGETKGRYKNIGSIWQGDNGFYMVLDRTFNPAGVPFKEGSDSIFVSMFEPRQDDGGGQRQGGGGQQQRQQAPAQRQAAPQQDLDDDIPF